MSESKSEYEKKINLSEISQDKEISSKDPVKMENEKKELISSLVAGNIVTLKERVALILNNSTESRNSDIELAWTYWQTFENKILNGEALSKNKMMALTKISSLSRVRAKIQNEYKLFQADNEVKKFRRSLEEDYKQAAIDDKPIEAGYAVYIDETGKNDKYLSIGSLWILRHGGVRTVRASMDLSAWKKSQGIKFEFHFTKLRKTSLQDYKDFFVKFLSFFPEVGFKLIIVRNNGFSDKSQAIVDLTFHLLLKGIEHEDKTGRAPLPRVLQVSIDDEEEGSDQLKLENIKERISGQKIKGLSLGKFEAISSSGNLFVQAVDLFTGAVNRKLNNPNGTHEKDELANFILEQINFNLPSIDERSEEVDNRKVFHLR